MIKLSRPIRLLKRKLCHKRNSHAVTQVMRLLQLYLVCPASTATAERSFSQLRQIKSYLRSTMKQERLNHLMLLASYPEELDNLDIEKLMKEFIMRNDQRSNTFHYE